MGVGKRMLRCKREMRIMFMRIHAAPSNGESIAQRRSVGVGRATFLFAFGTLGFYGSLLSGAESPWVFCCAECEGLRLFVGSGILGTFQMPWMGLGGAMYRTWSGRGRSSHKGPLASAHAYPRHWHVQRGRMAPLFCKIGVTFFGNEAASGYRSLELFQMKGHS